MHRQVISSKKRTKNMKAESHRVVQMYQVDRNSVCQSRVPLQNSRMCLFSMTSFSALDYKTDVALRKALKEHTTDSVVLIVAQRISTILHAEQIIVLDEGKVVGRGTHEELLKTCEVYQQIAMSQLSEEELAGKLGKEEKSHE